MLREGYRINRGIGSGATFGLVATSPARCLISDEIVLVRLKVLTFRTKHSHESICVGAAA